MRKVFKMDWIILVCTFSLIAIGLFTLYSLTNTSLESRTEFFKSEFTSQLVYGLVGLILSILVFSVPPVFYRFKAILVVIYISTVLLLLFTVFFGLDVRGVRRWIAIGSSVGQDGSITGGITIQPSEFAKFAVIIITASILSFTVNSSRYKNISNKVGKFLMRNINYFITIALNIVIIWLILAQKSLSVTLVLSSIIATIFISSIKNKLSVTFIFLAFLISAIATQKIFFNIHFGIRILLIVFVILIYALSLYMEKINYSLVFIAGILGILTGSLILGYVWNNVLHDFQRERIETYLNPNPNVEDEAYQQVQSQLSIGAGQIFGHGFRQIGDARLWLLPEPTTDFIFAIFAFKFGFVGSGILILLFLILILRLLYLADSMTDKFSSLVLIGVAVMILLQVFINIGMNMKILPVGGTTLPFISAGGSSLISMMISIALCQSIIANESLEKRIYKRSDKIIIDGWNQ